MEVGLHAVASSFFGGLIYALKKDTSYGHELLQLELICRASN